MNEWSPDDVREAFLSVAATGCLFGIAPEGEPAALAGALGRPFEDAVGDLGLVLRRVWGPVVAHYERRAPGEPWLWWALEVRPRVLPEPLAWEPLARVLAGHEFPVAPGFPGPGGDLTVHPLDAAGATARSVAPDGLGGTLPAGTAYDVAVHRDPLPAPSRERWSPMRNVLRRLAPQGPGAWADWADDAEPDHAALLVALRVLHVDQPARDAEWAAFGVWLLERARRRRVWPPAVHAYHLARFAEDHPSAFRAEDVVHAVRSSLPMPPAEAWAEVDWRRTTPEDVRYARLTRALLGVVHGAGA